MSDQSVGPVSPVRPNCICNFGDVEPGCPVHGSPVRDPAPPDFKGVDQTEDGCWFACIASLIRAGNALPVRGVRDPSPPEPTFADNRGLIGALQDIAYQARYDRTHAMLGGPTDPFEYYERISRTALAEATTGVRGAGVVPPEEKESRIESSPAYQELLSAERALSDAYLRLRRKLAPFGSFNTPTGPTGPQVWATTEIALDQALRGVVPSAPSPEAIAAERGWLDVQLTRAEYEAGAEALLRMGLAAGWATTHVEAAAGFTWRAIQTVRGLSSAAAPRK